MDWKQGVISFQATDFQRDEENGVLGDIYLITGHYKPRQFDSTSAFETK